MKDDEWDVMDSKDLATIHLYLVSTVAFNMMKEKTTEALITTLTKLYKKPSTCNKVFLVKKIFNMKMPEGDLVTNYLNEFNTVLNQLQSIEIEFKDKIRTLLLLCSLLESCNVFVMIVSNTASSIEIITSMAVGVMHGPMPKCGPPAAHIIVSSLLVALTYCLFVAGMISPST